MFSIKHTLKCPSTLESLRKDIITKAMARELNLEVIYKTIIEKQMLIKSWGGLKLPKGKYKAFRQIKVCNQMEWFHTEQFQ